MIAGRTSLGADAPVIVAARRTPVAARGGRLARLDVATLAGVALRASVADAIGARVSPSSALDGDGGIDDVVLGNCLGPGGNTARVAALAAGFGVESPGMTVDRQCGSGLAAILTGAQSIAAGANLVVAGGAESASTAPERRIDGVAYSRAPFAPAGFADPGMLEAAQTLAVHDGITRTAQDAFAARSHRLACEAAASGGFAAELALESPRLAESSHSPDPLESLESLGVRADDGPRENAVRVIGRTPVLDPAIPAEFGVTAGNSSRINDGAAAVVMVRGARRDRAGAAGLALRASAITACDPALPGIGPVDAIGRALDRAGVTLGELAAVELVEAFAAQALGVLRRIGLADGRSGDAAADTVDARVNASGGSLALGHPWGASGAISVVRLFTRLVRAGAPAGTLGLTSVAVGGGMGIAAVWEVVR